MLVLPRLTREVCLSALRRADLAVKCHVLNILWAIFGGLLMYTGSIT